MDNKLTVHAGLRPGELFILRAADVDARNMIVLPPATEVAHFSVEQGTGGTWRLVRHQGENHSKKEETLASFDSEEEATVAHWELTELLMQPSDQIAQVIHEDAPTPQLRKATQDKKALLMGVGGIALLLVLLIGGLSLWNRSSTPDVSVPAQDPTQQTDLAPVAPTPAQAPTQPSVAAPVQEAPAQVPFSPAIPGGFESNAPTAPVPAPAPVEQNLSEGDDFARMLNGG